jgi:hypothetical protein
MIRAFMLIVALQFYSVVMAQGDNNDSRRSLKGLTGVFVIVESSKKPELERGGVSENLIQTDVELRLRVSGIKVFTEDEAIDAPGLPTLQITISVSGFAKLPDVGTSKGEELCAYSVSTSLFQTVTLKRDPNTEPIHAATWRVSTTAAALASNLSRIRDSVKDLVDKFINAYLSVNPKK